MRLRPGTGMCMRTAAAFAGCSSIRTAWIARSLAMSAHQVRSHRTSLASAIRNRLSHPPSPLTSSLGQMQPHLPSALHLEVDSTAGRRGSLPHVPPALGVQVAPTPSPTMYISSTTLCPFIARRKSLRGVASDEDRVCIVDHDERRRGRRGLLGVVVVRG